MEVRRDIVIYLLILVASVLLYRNVTELPQLARYRQVGPGFWPRLCLLAIGALALGGLLRAARGWRKVATPAPLLLGRAPVQFLAVIALSLAYPFAMDVTGFLVATLLFQVAILVLLGIRRVGVVLAASGVNLALLYGIFARALQMPLPRGTGAFRALSLWFY